MKLNQERLSALKAEIKAEKPLANLAVRNYFQHGSSLSKLTIQAWTLKNIVVDYVEHELANGKTFDEIVIDADVCEFDTDGGEGLYTAVKYAKYFPHISRTRGWIDEMSTPEGVGAILYSQLEGLFVVGEDYKWPNYDTDFKTWFESFVNPPKK